MGKPKAYSVPSDAPTYTWLPPADNAPLATYEPMLLPLFQTSLPVEGSSAYRTAEVEALPPERAKITSFTIIGGRGAVISREAHPKSNAGVLLRSTTFHAAIPFVTGARIHRVWFRSSQLASAPPATFGVASVRAR